jgi:peptidoglycan hydrolase CwlO-like protein
MLKKNDNHMNTETRLAVLENVILHINGSIERIDKRFDHIDKRFDHIDKRFDDVDKKFDRLENKIDKTDNRLWLLFFWMISGFVGVLTFISHAFHWI